MIGIDGQLAGMTATAKAAEAEQKKEENKTTAGDIVDGVASGVDLVDLTAQGCKVVAEAVRPTHLTGGKDALSGFTTGGGDGAANTFQTVADCVPAAAGDMASAAGDIVGGIIGGIADGL
jgi:hypothetical protein